MIIQIYLIEYAINFKSNFVPKKNSVENIVITQVYGLRMSFVRPKYRYFSIILNFTDAKSDNTGKIAQKPHFVRSGYVCEKLLYFIRT